MVMILLLACIPAGISGWLQRDAVRATVVRIQQVQAADEWSVTMMQVGSWQQRVVWLDARPERVVQADGVKDALPLNEDDWDRCLPAVLDAWDPEAKLVVFCDGQNCHASREVARRLREDVGLEAVYYLQGGVQALRQWEQASQATQVEP